MLSVLQEVSIKFAAEQKNDKSLLCQIRGIDLIAKEAHYHNRCRRSYTRNEMTHSTNPNSEASAVLNAYRKVFELLCNYVHKNIIEQIKVERITMLRERYPLYLLSVDLDVHNENYKAEKPKEKLKTTLVRKFNFGGHLLKVSLYTQMILQKDRQ